MNSGDTSTREISEHQSIPQVQCVPMEVVPESTEAISVEKEVSADATEVIPESNEPMSVDIEPPVEAIELISKRVCVCAVADVNCAEILGELVVLIPPPEAELATAVAVVLVTPPDATELPVA